MTFDNFLERKKKLNITYPKLAEHIGYTPDAIKKWKHGQVPKWVNIVLNYLELEQKIKNDCKDNIIGYICNQK